MENRIPATILAALRHWQEHLEANGGIPAAIPSCFDHFEECTPLDTAEIDVLCLKINLGTEQEIAELFGKITLENEDVNCQFCDHPYSDHGSDGKDSLDIECYHGSAAGNRCHCRAFEMQ